MRRLALALMAVLAFGLSACTEYVPLINASWSALMPQLPADRYQIMGTGEGTACASYLLGIPTGGSNPYQTAVNAAIKSKNGDYFIQATTDLRLNYFPSTLFAIYLERCVTTQGLVIKFR